MTAKPDLDDVRKSVVTFESQMKWKWWFHHSPDPHHRRQCVLGLSTAPCPHVVPHELSTWLGFLRGAIFEAVRRGGSHSISARPSRVPLLVKWAFRLMRELQAVGIPNDKEYGCSLEAVEVQQVIHAETFGSNSYQEISPFDVNVVSIAERYAKLCIRIGRFERHASLGHSMVRTLGI